VPQDYATARGWYEKAAAQGNAWAQAQLALL
jgi:TPR repeat protein